MTSLNKNEFLNSNNFLNFSDTFYGAYIQHEDLHKFDKNNYRVLLDENGSCLIKNKRHYFLPLYAYRTIV